ncbi:60S ribosomal protein L34 [Tanacetum coccineum]
MRAVRTWLCVQEHIKKKYLINVSVGQCKRAKQRALFDHEGGLIEHYSRLWDYRKQLLDTNPGSSVHLHVDEKDDGKIHFKMIYIYFKAMIEGWNAGCRKVIGLDGCFLKGTCRGELLTAMGKDGNNQMFPIAWAVFNVENTDNWEWFLACLCEDLRLNCGKYMTIISDGHKGLMEVVKNLLPYAEHRQCARHIYVNFKKKWNGLHFKSLFWGAATSTIGTQTAGVELSLKWTEVVQLMKMVFLNLITIPLELLEERNRAFETFPKILDSVSARYSKMMWQNAYSYFSKPMGGSSMWPQTPVEPPLPPVFRKMPAGPSVADPSYAGPSVADPSSAGLSVADSTGSGTRAETVIEDPIVADPTDDIPTQQSKTSDTAKIIEDAIATGRLKTAGLKRRCKSERIAKRPKAFRFGKDCAGSCSEKAWDVDDVLAEK